MIKRILTLLILCFFFPFNSVFSDSKFLSPEEYVTFIAQETLDVLGNKNKSTDEKVDNITTVSYTHLTLPTILLV